MSGSEVDKEPEKAPGCYGDFGNTVLDCGTCSLTRECYKRTATRLGGPEFVGVGKVKAFKDVPKVQAFTANEVAQKDIEDRKQVGGDHYEKMGIDPWDVWDTWPLEQRIGAYRSNSIKYLMRMGTKDNVLQELKKARHYINKLIEVVENGN